MYRFQILGLFMLIFSVLSAQTGVLDVVQPGQHSECTQLAADADTNDQHVIASVARCYTRMMDNHQAARWYEQIVDRMDCAPQYWLEYGQCLKSLKLYGKAKFYFQKYAGYDLLAGGQFVQSCDVAKMLSEGDPSHTITPIPVNTAASEFAPYVRDNKLIFHSSDKMYTSSPAGAVKEVFDPAHGIDAPIAHARLSGDGKSVVFATSAYKEGQRLLAETTGARIYTALVTNDGRWIDVRPFPHNSDDYAVASPCLSHDGTTMYFAATMPDSRGGWDIWISRKSGSGWSTPENAGNKVNSPGNEISPFASGDMLYFSSDWHTGIGGFDIFSSRITDTGITDVRNMGFPLNSPKDDLDFVWDAATEAGYFASNRTGGIGGYDIYAATNLYREIEITIIDKLSMQPVEQAALSVSPGISMAQYTDRQGIARVQQPLKGERDVIVRKEGYQEQRVKLQTGGLTEPQRIYIDPVMKKTDVAQTPVQSKPTLSTPSPAPAEKPVPASSTQARTVSQPSSTATGKMQEMYFIQIAALARHASLSPYAHLRQYGELVVHEDASFARVRVGTFATEAEAREVLSRVKAGGYKDAFVVKHAVSIESEPSSSQSQSYDTEYKVRLGTYSKTTNFDPSRVSHLGAIEAYRKDELTIMLLAGYPSLPAAQHARDAAAAQGFGDAYVVMDKGGTLERVR